MASVEAALGSYTREGVLDAKSQAKAGIPAVMPDLSGVVTWIANKFSRFEPLFLSDVRVLTTGVVINRDRSRLLYGDPTFEFTTVRGIEDKVLEDQIKKAAERRLRSNPVGNFIVRRYQDAQIAARVAQDPDYARYYEQTGGMHFPDEKIDQKYFTGRGTRLRINFEGDHPVILDHKALKEREGGKWYRAGNFYFSEGDLGVNIPLSQVEEVSISDIKEDDRGRYRRHLDDENAWTTWIEPQPRDSGTIDW